MLVARAIDGDTASFAILFRRHAPAVHGFAQRRTRSVHLADDVVSSSFERAWHGLETLGPRHGDRFRPWVFRIAANELASMMRSSTRRAAREHLATSRGEVPADGNVGRDDSGPFQAIDSADEHQALLDAISELPERYQEVISLRYLSDLTSAETARELGISRGNVAVLLHRAVAAVRSKMEVES